MLLNLQSLIKKHDLRIKGVIHIGAHWGEEVITYLQNRIQPIALIEPAKDAYKRLENLYRANKHIRLFNCACGSEFKDGVLNVETANKGQSNSLLEPADHLRQYPDIQFKGTELVRVVPLDSLKLNTFQAYNMINSDCQGYEGEVFKGATETLKNIDYIYTEVNKTEVYHGCTKVHELDEILSDFTRVETGQWVNDSWTDALYIRKNLL